MADIEEQMEMFGYTAEGAKQEAKKLASGVNTDLTFKEAATTVGSMLPGIGTAMTVAEIEEELKKEDPSYGKIALLGGSEVIGLIPGLGTAAKSALKAAAKKIGANKIIDALDAPKPKTESEIIAGPGAKSYENENLKKAIELKKQGASPAEIETKTGRVETADDFITYKTPQGFDRYNIFKFEVDDTDAQLFGQYKKGHGPNPDALIKTRDASVQNPARLGQVLDHPELFKQYPKLKNIKFAFRSKKGQLGSFDQIGEGLGPTIFIDEKFKNKSLNNPKLRNVLFHEIQHAAQFADYVDSSLKMMAGNPEYFTRILSNPADTLGVARGARLRKNKKLMDTRKEILSLFDEYKDTGAFDVIVTYPNVPGLTVASLPAKTIKATDKFQGDHSFTQEIENLQIDNAIQQTIAGMGTNIDPKSAIQPLKVTPANPKMAKEVANKMLLLRRELHREYLKSGAEVEARVVGERAQFKGKPPNKKLSAEVAKQKRIETMGEFAKNKPDNFFTKKLKTFNEDTFTPGIGIKLTDDTVVDFLGQAVNLSRFDAKIDAKLDMRMFAEGGYTVRPEPIDGVDISPRYEAGDQFFVKQAERERAFETKPMPRPSMDKSFPNVKPEPRPEGRSEFITRGYEVDGREIQVGIIKFKGGEEIALDKVLQNIDTKGTADETPVLTERTILQVLDFVKEKNPTREEFETYWYNKRLNKGGAMMDKQMQMAFMDEGGLTDDGMDVDPVSGNDIPSGSMAEEVRDDIPAQLSDGEYVVPADVVRYYGVKFFEDLRERAKMGLQEMEMNGRIGGEPVPAGGPINTEELSPEEMQAIQEMMGMSQGGSVNAYKAQQELLEQPPAKAVGNPVMMSGGGQVRGYQDSSLVTSNLTEQNMLDAGNKASNDPYIGQDLGFSIFGPSNNQQGVQQTEVKPFTSVTLYNKSGQTRVANSAEEKAKAIADGYTMTLSEYNMYKSKTVGGGGGSGITPPGEGEDGEVKPWGQDLKNWNSVSDIKQFVAQAERGNLSGSGSFLRGAGFAIAGLPGAMLAGAFQSFKGLNSLYDMEAAQIIAEAKGKAGSKEHADLAVEIQTGIDTYLEKAGGLINFAYQPRSNNVMNKVNGVFVETGYDNLDSWAAGTSIKPKITKISNAGISKGSSGKGQAPAVSGRFDNMSSSDRAKAVKDTTGVTVSGEQAKAGDKPPSNTNESSTTSSGTIFNKGGLMTKGKKKK